MVGRAVNRSGFGGALDNLDQFKAFDNLNHRPLMSVSKDVGFGPVFKCWIKTTYNKIFSIVKLNVHFSKPFRIKR